MWAAHPEAPMWFGLFALVSLSHAGLFGKKKAEEAPPADEATETAADEAEEAEGEAEEAEGEADDDEGEADDSEADEGDANPEVPPFDPTAGGAPLPPMSWARPTEPLAFGTSVDVTLEVGGTRREAHIDADWAMKDTDAGWSLELTDVGLSEGSDAGILPEVWFVLAQPQLAEGDDDQEVRAYLPVDDLMSRLYRAMGTEPGALGQAAVGVKVAEAMKQGNVHAAASGQAELWAPLVLAGLRTSEVATALRLTGWLEGTGATEVIPVGEAACGDTQCVIVELRYTEGMGAEVETVSTRYRIEPEGLKVHGAQRRTSVWADVNGERRRLSILEKYLPGA